MYHPKDAREILKTCMDAFSAKYSNIPASRWDSTFEAEVTSDLLLMQQQPVIMEEYRRYIVLSGDERQPSSQDTVGELFLMREQYLI